MRILFIHDNYPAQFGALATYLGRSGWGTRYATAWEGAESAGGFLQYKMHRDPTEGVHPYAQNYERAVIKGQSAARAFVAARDAGYTPDVIMSHSGWGSGAFARDIWPGAKFIPYLEWWYNYPAPDTVSLGEHEPNLHNKLMQRARNAPLAMDMIGADMALCPTQYQASQFPADLAARLTVMHDGVDVDLHAPAPERPAVAAGLDLRGMEEIVTFFTRGMEPHRGYPVFMRALAKLQARRPGLHAIIGGRDRVAYGRKLPEGETWRGKMEAELAGSLDLSRVHYVGLQPRNEFARVLQATDAHVYLTADFVLSWSMLDAMATACPLICSNNPPVREFMEDGTTGLLTPMLDVDALVERVTEALDDKPAMRARGAAARAVITDKYAAKDIYAAKDAMLRELIGAPPPG